MINKKYGLFFVFAVLFLSLSAIDNEATSLGDCSSLSYTETLTATGSAGTTSEAETACRNDLTGQIANPSYPINCIVTCMQYMCTAEFTAGAPNCNAATWQKNTSPKANLLRKLLVPYGNNHIPTGWYVSTGTAVLTCNCKDIVPPERY